MTTCGALQVITVRFNMARVVDHNKKCNKEAAKQHLQAEQSKFEAARQLGGTIDVPPEDADHEDVIEKARMELGRPVAPAVPCFAKQDTTPCQSCGSNHWLLCMEATSHAFEKTKKFFRL